MKKINVFVFYIFLLFSLISCKEFRELTGLEEAKDSSSRHTKNAIKDFWNFSIGKTTDMVRATSNNKRKDVWSIQDKSVGKRTRGLVDVDADLFLPEKVMKDKGFRLARHLMLDVGADIVWIRFWSKGFREFGGVFAELVLSSDGRSWRGSKKGKDKMFRYVPSSRAWLKLSKKELQALNYCNNKFIRIQGKTDDPFAEALRKAAGKTGYSPKQLKKLIKKSKRMFYHPKK
jgi:hypothetical protein